MVLANHPLCVMCLAEGRVTAAAEVDHIIPLRDGGEHAEENLQPLCKPHHSRKTARDVRRRQGAVTVPVTIVTGPPGAGKTTYVAERAQWGDLIVDVDALYSALSGLAWYEKPDALLPFVLEARDAVLDRLHGASELRQAWIITSEADRAELARLKQRYSATVLVLEVDTAECLRRITGDSRRENKAEQWRPIIERWWEVYSRVPVR
jgi:predicted kinase